LAGAPALTKVTGREPWYRVAVDRIQSEARERPVLGAGAALAAYAALFVGFLVIGFAVQARDIIAGLWVTEAVAIALPALIVLRAANVRPGPYLGLSPPAGKWIAIAVVAGLANQPVVSLLEQAAHTFLPLKLVADFDAKNHVLDAFFAAHATSMTATVALAAPLGEELFFRGFAQPALARALGWTGAALVSGALFALLHLDPVGFLGLWEIGVLLAVLRHASGSLWPAVVAHAVNNAVAAAAFILGWQDPTQPPPAWFLVLGAVLFLVAIDLARRALRRPPLREPIELRLDETDGPSADRFQLARAWPLVAVWASALIAAGGTLLGFWPSS
jgi:membrane protease YdiL (CAAX protease family)